MEQNQKTVSPYSNESRNTYVIEHLGDAMFELLKDKPIGQITIRELCEKAEVGRTSFYRNYNEKEDIVKARLDRMFRSWVEQNKDETDPGFKEHIRRMFEHLEANREFYSLLNERQLIYLLKDVILDLCHYDPQQELPVAYGSAYIAYLLYGWIEVWFARGMKDRPEDFLPYLPG